MNIPEELANIIHGIIYDRSDEPEDDQIRILLRQASLNVGYIGVADAKRYLLEAQALADPVLKEHLGRIIHACDAEVAAEAATRWARKSGLTSKKSQ